MKLEVGIKTKEIVNGVAPDLDILVIFDIIAGFVS